MKRSSSRRRSGDGDDKFGRVEMKFRISRGVEEKETKKKRRYKREQDKTESSGHGLMMEDDGLERVEWMMGHSARGRDKGHIDRDGVFHFSILSFLFPLLPPLEHALTRS
jgi:hypothetical protein